MAALSGKELDDSIFGTDTHLDWADEVTMTEVLHGDTLGSGTTVDYNTKKPKPEQRSSSRADSSRGQRNSQQGSGRQSRQGVRPSRSNNDMNGSYNSRPEYRNSRGGQRGGRGRGRGGRSNNPGYYHSGTPYVSHGGNSYANQQANSYVSHGGNTYANQMAGQQQNGIPIANRRGSRDRSLSNERMGSMGSMGSMERSRGWNRPGSFGRPQRADMTDRWEHDRYEGNRSRARSGSNSERWDTSDSGVPPVIGKEGIAHVIIHRRGSSGSARGPPEIITSGLPPPRQQTYRRGSSGAEQASVEPPSEPAPEPLTPTIKEAEDEAEAEWENFVANGGLDMPLERITDDLCRQRAQKQQEQQKSEPAAVVPEPAMQTKQSSSRAPPRVLALDDEDDEDDDDDDGEEEEDDVEERITPSSAARKPNLEGISIRGIAKKTSPPASYTVPGEGKMATLVIDQVASPRARRPSIPIPEKAARYASPPSSASGIRIKGTSNGVSRAPPTQPTKPAQPSRPSPPASPRSRPSSVERTRTPPAPASTYMRRQFEGYDEDRGKHQFSLNIAYEDGRYAPIHVHERDDVVKLAAKYARTWRVHGKELRIKTTLAKMRAAVLESQLL